MWAFTAICEVTKRRKPILHIFRVTRPIFCLASPQADANRHNLAKVGVEGSNPFARSRTDYPKSLFRKRWSAGLGCC